MARTIEDVLAEASARPNPAGGNGILLRSDVLDVLEGLEEPDRHTTFDLLIDTAQFIGPLDKEKAKTDYISY